MFEDTICRARLALRCKDGFPNGLDLPAKMQDGYFIEFHSIDTCAETIASQFSGFGYFRIINLNIQEQFTSVQARVFRSTAVS